jgi:hypothetical protein
MAGKDQIAYRRFANIPAEGDRTLSSTQQRDDEGGAGALLGG